MILYRTSFEDVQKQNTVFLSLIPMLSAWQQRLH